MGGLGWIYRKQNNHVYLVYQISNKANTLGCMLAALIPEKFSFFWYRLQTNGRYHVGKE